MPELRLTTTSYVVLGMIALHGHCTPYGLKRAVGESMGLFWHFPHAQLYAEPDRLADLGLLARSVENGGRRRKTYSVTGPGLDALREWLAATAEHFQLRDIAELKLFFHEFGEPEHVTTLAAEQITPSTQRIALYDDLLAGGDAAGSPTLELGLELEHAALRFWTALEANDLPRLRARRDRE